MSKKKKLLARIRNSPKNVRFADIEKILLDMGFAVRKSKDVVFSRGSYRLLMAEPHPQPHVLPVYVKRFLALIDQIEADEAVVDEDDSVNNEDDDTDGGSP